ncbi:MAG: hypothetical protein FWC64_11645 [Treponema sp.]|nr:hypothetical protein [Treponema sp.]
MNSSESYAPSAKNIVKFAAMSVVGVFLFMVPIPHTMPDGNVVFNIPLGYAINWLGSAINSVQVNGFGLIFLLACVVITVSFLGSALAYTVKPAFIMNSDKLKNLFLCNIVYFISKAVGAVLAWLVFFSAGPDWLIGWGGGRLMMDLIASGSGLMAIFIVIGIAIPLLTDFGLMEFLGVLIKKVIRFLFTLPGRSSIDLLGSWFSSSAASVIITRDQHEKGYYTGREAAAICVNFTLVSLPFTFVVASTIGLTAYFALFYVVICVTAILLAVIMPRIWPLSRIKDEYLPEVGKQIEEETPANVCIFRQAVKLAGQRAGKTGPTHVAKAGLSNWLNIFMDLIPIILAWGTVALVINEVTPVFRLLSWPFGQFLRLLQVEGAMYYAHIAIVGFIDMYLPAILMGTEAPIHTRFILGALSIVQIIYMAETGILILKSKIPLNIGHLAIIFVMRTIFALPVIVLLARLLFRPAIG